MSDTVHCARALEMPEKKKATESSVIVKIFITAYLNNLEYIFKRCQECICKD
jgi:hypothetical protein